MIGLAQFAGSCIAKLEAIVAHVRSSTGTVLSGNCKLRGMSSCLHGVMYRRIFADQSFAKEVGLPPVAYHFTGRL